MHLMRSEDLNVAALEGVGEELAVGLEGLEGASFEISTLRRSVGVRGPLGEQAKSSRGGKVALKRGRHCRLAAAAEAPRCRLAAAARKPARLKGSRPAGRTGVQSMQSMVMTEPAS